MTLCLLLHSVRSSACINSRCVSSSFSIFYRNQSHHRKKILKTPQVKRFRSYIVDRYVTYVKKYDKALEQRFPTAMRIYRSFVNGCHDFYNDLKCFVSIYRELNRNGFEGLQRRDIELYYKMKQDMKKVAPVLIVSTLPLANYLIFPLIFMFPKQLLSSHFWSLQQKAEFAIVSLRDRLSYQKPVFRSLQDGSKKICKDDLLHKKWEKILAVIGSGSCPCVDDVLECKQLFYNAPYGIDHITNGHARKLLNLHGIKRRLFFKRNMLAYRARLLKEMDLAIQRENDICNIATDELRHICLIRGLNPANMSREELQEFLEQWLLISNATNRECYSLILHAPILLAYNHPNNWILIYKD